MAKDIEERFSKYLEKIEEVTGLGKPDMEDLVELRERLSYGRNVFESMSADECLYISHDISRYLLYLGGVIGRTKAKLHWYEIQLNKRLGETARDFNDIYGNEAKRSAAIMSFEDTIEMYDKIAQCNVVLDRTYSVMEPIKMLKQDINDIKINKMMKQKEMRDER